MKFYHIMHNTLMFYLGKINYKIKIVNLCSKAKGIKKIAYS